jgi:hypothetical protein
VSNLRKRELAEMKNQIPETQEDSEDGTPLNKAKVLLFKGNNRGPEKESADDSMDESMLDGPGSGRNAGMPFDVELLNQEINDENLKEPTVGSLDEKKDEKSEEKPENFAS